MKPSDVWVAPQAIATILAAARTGERAEPCGVLLGFHVPRGMEVTSAAALRNVHPSPDRAFLIDPDALLRAAREAVVGGHDLVGFWHAHLEGPAWPGMLDEEGMASAHSQGFGPYVHLVAGKGSTGKQVLRAFRMGRTRAKQVALHVLRRARGALRPPPQAALI